MAAHSCLVITPPPYGRPPATERAPAPNRVVQSDRSEYTEVS
jgi:hypothetical protein